VKWVALVLVVACKPTAGGKCDDPVKIVCTGSSSALVCADKHWAPKSCAQGCIKKKSPDPDELNPVVCDDTTTPVVGEPCYLTPTRKMITEESACSADRRAILRCELAEGTAGGGFWKTFRTCGTGKTCRPGLFCD
jgi:hypothetical protein